MKIIKNTPAIVIIFILCIGLYLSCDLIISPEFKEKPTGDIFITIVFDLVNPGYWHWVDEVTIFQNGYAAIRRLEGDSIPETFRLLSDEELYYIGNIFRDFDTLGDSYLRESYQDPYHYTITYIGNEDVKTVECDNSIFDHQIWYDPEYEILKKIVTALYDVRISLIGEGKYSGRLEFNFSPEKTYVNIDDDVLLHYEVRNNTNRGIDVMFLNQQQIGYKVYHNGALIAEYPTYFFPAGSTWRIPARISRTQKISWKQTVHRDEYENTDRKVKSGDYTIVQYLLDGNSPYSATTITITEKGDLPLQSRAIKSYSRPQELIFELNNRTSKEYSFVFNSDRPVGYKITSIETGEVIRSDSSGSPAHIQLTIEPFGEYVFSEPWDGRDSEGIFLQQGMYELEMWLIGQVPDYRATREFFIMH
jgi:hypothetical protein